MTTPLQPAPQHSPHWASEPPKSLVMGGGGLSCIAFTGALRRLEERHPNAVRDIELFVGCSAGAVLAFLFAMGMSPTAARDWCHTRILALSANELDLEGVFDITSTLGIDNGARIDGLVREALALWGLCSTVTFAELAAGGSAKELVVCVANVTRGRREFMSARLTPRVPVALALRMSMAVPLLYTPVLYRGAVYVDGGLVDNCPVAHWFSRVRATAPSALCLSPVLVLDLVDAVKERNDGETLPTLQEYVRHVFNTTIGSAAQRTRRCRARAASHGDMEYVAITPRSEHPFFSHRSLSFEMSATSVEALDRAGYQALDAKWAQV